MYTTPQAPYVIPFTIDLDFCLSLDMDQSLCEMEFTIGPMVYLPEKNYHYVWYINFVRDKWDQKDFNA